MRLFPQSFVPASGRPALTLARGWLLWFPLIVVLPSIVRAQATYTASRAGDLQLGVGGIFGSSNYLTPALGAGFTPKLEGSGDSLKGFALYSSFDFKPHFGAEISFRQTTPSYGANVSERTYEIGARYVYPIRSLKPFARAMYGRGVFNYPDNIANLAYNLYSLGAGVDFSLTRSLNVRAEYEHQHWFGFPLTPLQPNLATIGVAYHFSGKGHCALCARR